MSLFDADVKERFNNIHADNDPRSYRGLVLKNKMKILLISDESTDISIAAMSVNIGYKHDPKDLPGLAHLCQHMLDLGTRAHPQQNEYLEYLNQNGGSRLATTRINSTDYSFNIIPEKLKEALELFAQFFIAPSFPEDLIEKEINAIDFEYKEKLRDDRWRFIAIEKLSVRPDHPYSKFGTGNEETLYIIPKGKKINVTSELSEFYKRYYSANIMSLCVLGTESLDDLENMVVKHFRNVKNKKVKLPMYSGCPFKDEDFNTMWYYVPIGDIRDLRISFILPEIKREDDMRLCYIKYLLGHKGEGSLLSALKAKNWCNDIEIEECSVDTSVYFFRVLFDLTEEGIEKKNIDQIVQIMFQYIHMLKENGVMKWETVGSDCIRPYFATELKQIRGMYYNYEKINRLSPDDIATTAYLLHECPMEKIFERQLVWRPDLINKKIMEHVTPQKIRIYVAAKKYENTTNETEKWYGVKYKKEKISPETIKMWNTVDSSTDLKLPSKNEFIPMEFVIKTEHEELNVQEIEEIPVMVKDEPLVRVWHKKDDVFRVPKATMIFHFVSPFACMDPLNCNLTNMFVQLLRDFLNENQYIANVHKYEYTRTVNITSLKWEIACTKYGITLKMDGYDDKQRDWLEKTMDRMINFEVNPKRFNILKEKYIRELKNFAIQQPFQHAMDYLELLLSEQHWSHDELLESTDSKYLCVGRLQDFIQQLFTEMHVECLIHGNVIKEDARGIGELIKSKLETKKLHITHLLQKQLVLYRVIELENGCHVLFEKENEVQITSTTIVYYATGLRSTESSVLLSLLAQIIKKPCFDILRTKKQLVLSDICTMNGTQYLQVVVQSDRDPQKVENQIDLFMESMLDQISTMSEQQFDNHKKSLVLRLKASGKGDTITSQCSLYWKEIESQEYNFNRVDIEVRHLDTITLEQLQEFFKEKIHDKFIRRKLSVHVMTTAMVQEREWADKGEKMKKELSDEGKKKERKCEEELPVRKNYRSGRITVTTTSKNENIIKTFDDLLSFKLSQSLYPLLGPIDENVVRKGIKCF